MEVGNAGKKQKDEGMSTGDRCCGIICSASDGDFKTHKSNLGICSLIYSLHRMLTVYWRLSKEWGPGSENGKRSLCLHSAWLCSLSIMSLCDCDHPALRDNSREEGGPGGGGVIVSVPPQQQRYGVSNLLHKGRVTW